MQPDMSAIAVPTTRGRDAMEWMSAHGVVPRRRIPIRSSDFDLAMNDEFAYYLKMILGLGSALSWSKALNRGSWFHKRLELLRCPPEKVAPIMEASFKAREQELRDTCNAWGLSKEDADASCTREYRSFKCAWAWFEAGSKILIPSQVLGSETNFVDFLQRPQYLLLATEALVMWTDPTYPKCPFVAVIDQLYYDKSSNQIWILDGKTCAEIPILRLETCKIEFQTQHYIYIVMRLLESGMIHQKFPFLPKDVTLGGMVHLAVMKPTIDYNKTMDRPFNWVAHTLKSGKRKGQIDMRKEYLSDEPNFDLYIERVGRWYEGTGEYEDDHANRLLNRPVNFSFSQSNIVLDSEGLEQYHLRLRRIYDLATRDPYPQNFVSNPAYLREYTELKAIAPFYLLEPKHWPEVIARNRMIQFFRDESVAMDSQSLLEPSWNPSPPPADPSASVPPATESSSSATP